MDLKERLDCYLTKLGKSVLEKRKYFEKKSLQSPGADYNYCCTFKEFFNDMAFYYLLPEKYLN